MAQSFQTAFGNLIIPGAYPTITVQTGSGGIASNGIIMLVGEADQGPRFDAEGDLSLNAFGPDQLASVVAKYKSGPIVDGFRAAVNAPNDPNLQGAPTAVIIAKTNQSVKATGTLLNVANTTYATLGDKSFGALGNLIYWKVLASQSEVAPTTGTFTYIPPVGTVGVTCRVNGGAAETVLLSANEAPNTFVADMSLAGLTTTGGVDDVILTVAGNLTVTANPGGAGLTVILLTRSINWNANPSVGDTLIIPMGSAVAGGANANVGAYVITAFTSATITATKLSDAGKAGAVIGTITNPANVASTPVGAVTDAKAWSAVSISVTAGNVIDGVGKSLEIGQTTAGTDLLNRTAFLLGTVNAVSWISVSGTPTNLASGLEFIANLQTNRQLDNISENLTAGGEVALVIGYTGTTATLTVTATTLTTSVTGGSGANLTIPLAQFPTINDLATFINTQTGYTASVGTAVLGQLPSTALDQVSAIGICTQFGAANGRVKIDAFRFFNTITNNSVLVQLNVPPARAALGLPKVTSAFSYLTGGAKGGSANSDFTSAMDALQNVVGNFLIPLVSRDSSVDIANTQTDASSTYTIDAINAYAKSHVLLMSTLKKRKNRQAFTSKEDTFVNAKAAAANLASFRVSMNFQDFKQTDSNGNLTQFRPWMGACLAAGMQAAGFYRAIVNKGINTSGIVSLAGDFNPLNDTQMEQALQAGLLPVKKSLSGGFVWVSDQTTYGKDNNFVFNSIQAVYAADVVALSLAQSMERAFVGQSVADVSAAVALSFLESQMANFLRLKLIAPSSDAPLGFKNASIQINGPAMIVNVEIKLAGAIYFIPISFLVSAVTQSAGA